MLAAALAAAPAHAFDPVVEAQNFNKGQERQTIYNTPEYQALLDEVSRENFLEAVEMQATDPERDFIRHICSSYGRACAGDARLYEWEAEGYGIVEPVLFTARSGATLSGRVWATRAGPAKRPLIVITNGSVQAPETLYWFAAQALAKAGYVVLTFDPQGQGRSDERGEPPDEDEGSPAQTDGRPFVDGTEDAINFALSDPANPYRPLPSCSSGTSHAPKQERRVEAGLNAAYNPLWELVDKERLGLAGHSYGAAGVSYIGQRDPRVKAIVAWDNLRGNDPNAEFGGSGGALAEPCPADPSKRVVAPITKPALGISADYFIPPRPNTSDPDPLAKSEWSRRYSDVGVDTGELVIRGGTHYEMSFLPDPAFPATLRGADMTAWYTTAWFDKYVKGSCTADRRLLTSRWHDDAAEAEIDEPNHDGNMYSFYYRSRLDFRLDGGERYTNENLRDDTHGLTAEDGYDGEYAYIDINRSADDAVTDFGSCPAAAGRRPKLRVKVRPRAVRTGRRVRFRVRVTARVDGRRQAVRRAQIRFAGRAVLTRRNGRARITKRFRATGLRRVRASRVGYRPGRASVRVRRAARAPRFTG